MAANPAGNRRGKDVQRFQGPAWRIARRDAARGGRIRVASARARRFAIGGSVDPRKWFRSEKPDRDSTIVVDPESGVAIGTEADLSDNDPDPVHDVLRKTDVWFSYKASALEGEARELASAHAEKGQPRHDLAREGPLEMELLLERHAGEVMWGWMDRVHRKMQGAIGAETEAIGLAVAAAKRAVANAEAAHAAYENHPRPQPPEPVALVPAPAPAPDPDAPAAPAEPEVIEVERHLGSAMFYVLSALLICADFLANVPVFMELFPANHLLDEAFKRWEMQALLHGLTSGFGIRHLVTRVLAYPEPSLLALSVIVFFLVLGHVLGGALRVLVALWRHRVPRLSFEGSLRWRQALWPAWLSLAGVLVVVCVLYAARAKVEPMATTRVRVAETALDNAIKAFDQASADTTGLVNPGALAGRVTAARRELQLREERLEYATALSGMNLPITFLNVVLVMAAVVLGYQHRRERITVVPAAQAKAEERAEQASDALRVRMAEMQARLDGLRGEFLARRGEAHQAMRDADTAFNRVEHLLEAEVMRDWQAKAERLRRAIPLFRTENARLRGLDVGDVLAFRTEYVMSLPTPDQQAWQLDRPAALDLYRAEFGVLQGRLHRLDMDLPGETIPHILTAA
jgi:hypothetical protein